MKLMLIIEAVVIPLFALVLYLPSMKQGHPALGTLLFPLFFLTLIFTSIRSIVIGRRHLKREGSIKQDQVVYYGYYLNIVLLVLLTLWVLIPAILALVAPQLFT